MWCPNPDCPDREVNGRPGEYVDTVVRCPFCGAELVAALPPEEVGGADDVSDDLEDLDAVLEVSDPAEIEIVRSILDGAEIPYLTSGQERGAARRGGHVSYRLGAGAGAVVFSVPRDRVEEARALLTPAEPEPPGGEE